MSPKKLFIILVILILLILGLVGLLFLFPPKQQTVPTETQQPPAAAQQPTAAKPPSSSTNGTVKQIKEFDDSIFYGNTDTRAETQSSAMSAELQLMARNFLETYASFSSNSGYARITGLYEKMTPAMKAFTVSWIEKDPSQEKSSNFYSIQTEVLQTEMRNATKSHAAVLLDTRRTETDAPEFYNKLVNQTARVELKKISGVWKVDGVFWE